jgi:hypothetical protein
MNFKFSKNQTVRASQNTELGDVKKGTRGRVVTHRADPDVNVYLVKFRGAEHYVACKEQELEKV